jgi:hypothetical protein
MRHIAISPWFAWARGFVVSQPYAVGRWLLLL